MTFDEFIKLPRSEKITLVKAQSSQECKIFTPHMDGYTYYRDVEFFVFSVRDELFGFTQVYDIPSNPREFYFNQEEKRLYIRTSSLTDPRNHNIIVTYQHFFSTAPLTLPHDLDNGYQVEYEPIVDSIGNLGQQLDDENSGIVLESSSNVKFINSGSFFDDIYDTLIWENKSIEFYLWSPLIPVSEAKRIFSGVIESKSYGDDFVTFTVKDFVFRLQGVLNIPKFSTDDGRVPESVLGNSKKRIYGRVKQHKCQTVSAINDGYSNYGLISGSIGNKFVTGSNFLSYLTKDDTIKIIVNNEEIDLTVDSVTSNTQFELSEELEVGFTNLSFTWIPSNPVRSANREWNVSGHKLFEESQEILFVTDSNRFVVGNVSSFFHGDLIKIGSSQARIRRISGNTIVTETSIFPVPMVGEFIEKSPVYAVRNGIKLLIQDRDYTIDNTTDYCNVVLDDLAEFNTSKVKTVSYTFTFTNGSRSVTTSTATDLRQIINPNDWIKQDSGAVTNWYEVLDVKEQEIILRTNSLESGSVSLLYKSIDMIGDDSLVTIDCIGAGYDFGDGEKWLKTPSDVARHLIQSDAGFTDIDVDSFNKANEECGYIMSLVTPDGDDSEKIKDVLTKVNDSCFGSVFQNNDLNISFSILNSKKPDTEVFLSDDDILDWSSDTSNKICNVVEAYYRPYIDITNGDEATEFIRVESDFVNRLTGIVNTIQKTFYLYEEESAKIMAQRVLFFNSLSLGRVTVKTKINLHNKSVNDKIYISLDRLFRRYGGRTKKKIGVISSIKKNGTDNEVTFNDLGNVFNRVPSIAPLSSSDYGLASEEDKSKYGYIVDNLTLTPDSNSELELGNNLIG